MEGIIQGVQSAQSRILERYGITFSAHLSRFYPVFLSVNTSYREILLALDFKLWADKKVIIFQDIKNTRALPV